MATPQLTLLDLPDDILVDNICPLLDADDFLSLCSTCSRLRTYSRVASYWRPLLFSTFQLPPQPLLQADGPRWKDMYQRLSKKSLLFTWGSVNSMRGQFGHVDASRARISHAWPTPLMPHEIDGIVVQVACGGRSLTMRTSKGILYSIGDQEMNSFYAAMELRRLEFPRGNPEPGASPSTTIVAMSKGRFEVLGLSANGRIWCWSSNSPWGREVNFSDLHSLQSVYDSRNPERGQKITCPRGVKLICSGWGGNVAYLEGLGIAFWDRDENPIRRSNSIGRSFLSSQPAPARDVELKLVPGTGFLNDIDARDQFNAEVTGFDQPLGQVTGLAYLEDDIVVFLTDNGKAYAATKDSNPVLLQSFQPPDGETKFAQIEGSFRSFALMNTSGSVFIGTKDIINAWFTYSGSGRTDEDFGADLLPVVKPALQHKGIVSLAFGDWHQLALTADGKVIGFGHEPENCGCLGIGGYRDARAQRGTPDAMGEMAAPEEGLEIFFSRWMRDASSFASRSTEIVPGFAGLANGEDTKGAHFAYQIAAGGWLSAALVLFDDDKDEVQRKQLSLSLRQHIPGIEKEDAFWPFSEERPTTLVTDDNNGESVSAIRGNAEGNNGNRQANPRNFTPNAGRIGGLAGLRGPMLGRGRIGVPDNVRQLPHSSVGELMHGGQGAGQRPRSLSTGGGEGSSSPPSSPENQGQSMFSRIIGSVSDMLMGTDRAAARDEDNQPTTPPPPQPGAIPRLPVQTGSSAAPPSSGSGAIVSDTGVTYVPANNNNNNNRTEAAVTTGRRADGVTPSTATPAPVGSQQSQHQHGQDQDQDHEQQDPPDEDAPPGTGGFLRDA